jgi:hypothetical protein
MSTRTSKIPHRCRCGTMWGPRSRVVVCISCGETLEPDGGRQLTHASAVVGDTSRPLPASKDARKRKR